MNSKVNLTSETRSARTLKPSGAPAPKYIVTPQILEELRLAYVGNKREVSANLTRLSTRYEIPRHRLTHEARCQGWRLETRRPWTAEEDAFLQGAGKADYGRLAVELRRTWTSVEERVLELQRSQAAAQCSTDGFDAGELAGLFGVGLPKVQKWIGLGLLGKSARREGADRIPGSAVARFVRNHCSEYSFERVNQSWFKAFVFGGWSRVESSSEGETCL